MNKLLCIAIAAVFPLAGCATPPTTPAVVTARTLLTDPRFIEVHRLGTFPERSLDIDVVFDLMIHDLNLVMSLLQQKVVDIRAVVSSTSLVIAARMSRARGSRLA